MIGPAVTGPDGREPRSRPLLRTMLGEVLRRTRLEQGRTLADVARVARVSLPYLSELERGRKEASSEVLAAICDALRIELAELLAEAGRGLAVDRASRARVIRLRELRGLPGAARAPGTAATQAPPAPPGSASEQCLLAA